MSELAYDSFYYRNCVGGDSYRRDRSWLAFNARVLAEAGDTKLPLLERLDAALELGELGAGDQLLTGHARRGREHGAGVGGGVLALCLLVYAFVAHAFGEVTPGWTSTVVAVAAMGALQLLCLGILGEYVGRTYAAIQARPAYFVAYDSGANLAVPLDEPLGGRQLR